MTNFSALAKRRCYNCISIWESEPLGSIRDFIYRFRKLFIISLVEGKSSTKPAASVIRPGVTRNAPETRISIPLKSSSVGITPELKSALILKRHCMPAALTMQAPIKPVMIIIITVSSVPITVPSLISRASSKKGIMVKRRKSLTNISVVFNKGF